MSIDLWDVNPGLPVPSHIAKLDFRQNQVQIINGREAQVESFDHFH